MESKIKEDTQNTDPVDIWGIFTAIVGILFIVGLFWFSASTKTKTFTTESTENLAFEINNGYQVISRNDSCTVIFPVRGIKGKSLKNVRISISYEIEK